jgi:hypothetical protein
MAAFDEPLDHDVGNATIERLGPEMSGGRHRLLVVSERVDVHLVCRVQLSVRARGCPFRRRDCACRRNGFPPARRHLRERALLAGRALNSMPTVPPGVWVPFPAVGSGSKRRDRTCLTSRAVMPRPWSRRVAVMRRARTMSGSAPRPSSSRERNPNPGSARVPAHQRRTTRLQLRRQPGHRAPLLFGRGISGEAID